MQLEKIEQHFNKVNLNSMKKGGKNYFTPAQVKSSPIEVLGKVCALYMMVRPIFSLLVMLPFLKKLRETAKGYTALMDQLCPDAVIE